jgi:hypothetical protein
MQKEGIFFKLPFTFVWPKINGWSSTEVSWLSIYADTTEFKKTERKGIHGTMKSRCGQCYPTHEPTDFSWGYKSIQFLKRTIVTNTPILSYKNVPKFSRGYWYHYSFIDGLKLQKPHNSDARCCSSYAPRFAPCHWYSISLTMISISSLLYAYFFYLMLTSLFS